MSGGEGIEKLGKQLSLIISVRRAAHLFNLVMITIIIYNYMF